MQPRLVGFLDRIEDSAIVGWALNAEKPSEALEVELLLNGHPVARSICTSHRDDVRRIYPQAGACGFALPIPREARNGSAQKLAVRVAETNFYLDTAIHQKEPVELSVIDRNADIGESHFRARVASALRPYPGALVALNADPALRFDPELLESDILFVAGIEGPSASFRVYNVVHALQGSGLQTVVHSLAEVPFLLARGHKTRTLVLFRCPWSQDIEALCRRIRGQGGRIVFDTDDLVFDQSVTAYVDGMRFLSYDERRTYFEGIQQYRACLLAADLVTASSVPLVEAARSLGKQAFLVPNIPPRENRAAARQLVGPELGRSDSDPVLLGYFSGTKTHQADFAICEPAIVQALATYPFTRLRVVGELDLREFPSLTRMRGQIETYSVRPYVEMFRLLAECSVNLAPLEIGNPFCEAKSELKFFDAAMVGVPSICSATVPYANAIQHGTTGYLARNVREWHESLSSLINDTKLRHRMGAAAKSYVQEIYSEASLQSSFLTALGLRDAAPAPQKEPIRKSTNRKRGASKKISFVVPEILIGGGGHRKIFRVAYDLERFGHEVSIYITSDRAPSVLTEEVRKYFYPLAGRIEQYCGFVRETDWLVATSWPTAYLVDRHRGAAQGCAYFVQDYEPLFAPVSSSYVQALHTYRLGLKTITLGRWVQERLKSELGIRSEGISFPLDHATYQPKKRYLDRQAVLFFAKPTQPRRLYQLGIDALQQLKSLQPSVEIILFGEEIDPAAIPAGMRCRGLIERPNDLADLYTNADVGVAFSPTNPSLVGYEMLACGLPIVDLDLPGAPVNYGGEDVALLAHPTTESICAAILRLLSDRGEHAARRKAGLALAAQLADDIKMSEAFEELLLKR